MFLIRYDPATLAEGQTFAWPAGEARFVTNYESPKFSKLCGSLFLSTQSLHSTYWTQNFSRLAELLSQMFPRWNNIKYTQIFNTRTRGISLRNWDSFFVRKPFNSFAFWKQTGVPIKLCILYCTIELHVLCKWQKEFSHQIIQTKNKSNPPAM